MSSFPSQQISTGFICGDECPAVVVDIGTSTSRFGTGGQEMPRHIFRSEVGVAESSNTVSSRSSSSSSSSSSNASKRRVGDLALRCVCSDVETERPFSPEGQVHWDNVEALMDHGISRCMKIASSEYSMMLAESRFEDMESKKKMLELCFEKFSSPAAYMSPNASLSSFSAGRPTSFVLDFGASGVRISPLIDGYVLKNAEMKTSRGGDWLDAIVAKELETIYPNNVKPWFEADGKTYPTPRASFRNMHVKDIVKDVKRWMCFAPYIPVAPEMRCQFIYETIQLPPYELPDGTMVTHFDALCTGPERWFSPDYFSVTKEGLRMSAMDSANQPQQNLSDSREKTDSKSNSYLPAHRQVVDIKNDEITLQELTMDSLMKCDVDARKEILSNVLLVGGGSNIDGISHRLNLELSSSIPSGMKFKINAQLPNEKQHAAWIGGSILSICGSFQQMWISKQEYQEYGPNICNQRLS